MCNTSYLKCGTNKNMLICEKITEKPLKTALNYYDHNYIYLLHGNSEIMR